MIVSLIVICLLLLYPLLRPSSPAAHGSAPPSAGSPTAAPAAAAPAAATTPPPTQLTLQLAAAGESSWLQVVDENGHTLYQQELAAGASQTVTGQALTVRVGNAGATRLTCNGKDLGSLGGSGQVTTVRLALGSDGACTVTGR
jgi:hypothetical protein